MGELARLMEIGSFGRWDRVGLGKAGFKAVDIWC